MTYRRSAPYYDAIYTAIKDYQGEANRLDELIRARCRSGGRSLLDVACGTGLHLEQLRARYDVEGIDLDGDMLEVARRRLPGVPLRRADMSAFDLGREFDVVTCLFSAIGHLQGEDQLRSAIACMSRHLRPGGLVIVEPWLEKEAIDPARAFGADFVDEPQVKIARLSRLEVVGDRSAVHFWYLAGTPEDVEFFTEDHLLSMFTRDQFQSAFAAAGLHVEHDAAGLMGRGLYLGSKAL